MAKIISTIGKKEKTDRKGGRTLCGPNTAGNEIGKNGEEGLRVDLDLSGEIANKRENVQIGDNVKATTTIIFRVSSAGRGGGKNQSGGARHTLWTGYVKRKSKGRANNRGRASRHLQCNGAKKRKIEEKSGLGTGSAGALLQFHGKTKPVTQAQDSFFVSESRCEGGGGL